MEEKNKAIFSLSRDILRKIKNNDVQLSNILLQAAELSHLVGHEENIKFFIEGSQKVEKSQIYLDTYASAIEATKDPTVSITSANPNEFVGWNMPKGNHLERQNLRLQQQIAIQTIGNYKTQTYEYVMKIYYVYMFGNKASSILDEYKKKVTSEIAGRFPDLKSSFEILDKNINSGNPREWASVALECRSILINLSGQLWNLGTKNFKRRNGNNITTDGEKNKLIAYIETKIKGSELEKAMAERLCASVHEIFAIAGKSKRKVDKNELSTVVVSTFVLLADLITYTDLKPVS